MSELTKNQQILRDIRNVMFVIAQVFFWMNFIFIFGAAIIFSFSILMTICNWIVNCLAYEEIVDFYPMLHDTFWKLRHF